MSYSAQTCSHFETRTNRERFGLNYRLQLRVSEISYTLQIMYSGRFHKTAFFAEHGGNPADMGTFLSLPPKHFPSSRRGGTGDVLVIFVGYIYRSQFTFYRYRLVVGFISRRLVERSSNRAHIGTRQVLPPEPFLPTEMRTNR